MSEMQVTQFRSPALVNIPFSVGAAGTRFRLVCAAIVTFAAILAAPAVASAGDKSPKEIAQDEIAVLVEQFKAKSGKSAAAGVSIIDLKTGKAFVQVDDDKLLMPASNQKVLTSAFALATLGGQYKFTTAVYLAGDDLVILGDYDPTFGDPFIAEQNKGTIYDELDKWSAAVAKKLDGKKLRDIVACTDKPAASLRHADWPRGQYSTWYSAPVAMLSFNNNCYDVTISAGPAANVAPASRFIQIAGTLKKGAKTAWSLQSAADEARVTINGTAAGTSTTPISSSCENPPMMLARTLADRLVRAKVEFTGAIRDGDAGKFDPSGVAPVASTQTPLATVMARANKRSLNMAAECMFLRAGGGDWTASAKKMTDTLTKTYNLPAESFKIADGSGYSRNNRVAPAAMTKLLTAILERKEADVFIRSLPVCGVDGTMDARLADAPYKGRVLGKTGYIVGVSCLSGYVLGSDDKPAYAFSILTNGVSGPADAKTLQDSIAAALVDSLPKK